MFTKTITLAGAELSSFLAAGGQTVDPNAGSVATTSAVAQVPFPTVVTTTTPTTTSTPSTTSTPVTTAAAVTTGRPVFNLVTTPSTTSTTTTPSSTSTSAVSTVLSSAAASTSAVVSSSRAQTSSTVTSAAARISSAARATSSAKVSSSARSVGVNALTSATKKASASKGIGGGGIAGIIIGLLLGFALIGALLFFWRKRRNERREEALNEKRQRDLKNEKGIVRLEEAEIKSPGEGGGFDFGHLPPIVPDQQMKYDANNFSRSASPAQMDRGAAVLGIQRPYTPPPGHPAHPNYRQPPALAANRQMQQQAPQQHAGPAMRNVGPQPAPMNMPRKPVPTSAIPLERSMSNNNPFSDPPTNPDVAPPLEHTSSPLLSQRTTPVIPAPQAEATRRASLDSFVAGDDSFGETDATEAATAAKQASLQDMVSPKTQTVGQFADSSIVVPVVPTTDSASSPPLRTKSVMAASDNWAARKAHLKNTLALQGSSSRPTSPNVEQSPFADPAPSIDHEITTLSPMDLNFNPSSVDGKI